MKYNKEVVFAKKILDSREYGILSMRHGWKEGDVTHTLEEVGKKFGVTRERIRQIEALANLKLDMAEKHQVDSSIKAEKSIHPEVDYRDEEDFANAMHQKKADESKY